MEMSSMTYDQHARFFEPSSLPASSSPFVPTSVTTATTAPQVQQIYEDTVIAKAQEVVQCNHEGVKMLETGRFADALVFFSRSIQLVRGLLQQSDCPRALSLLQLKAFQVNHPDCCDPQDSSIKTNAIQDHNPLSLCPTVFGLALAMPSPLQHDFIMDPQREQRQRKTIAWISAGLLYNIAFSRQMCARSKQKTSKTSSYHKECKASARFYSMAAAAIGHPDAASAFGTAEDTSNYDLHASLWLAIYNNWAHISVQLMDWRVSSHCRDVLRRVLSLYPQDTDDERNVIVMNILLLDCERHSAAAA